METFNFILDEKIKVWRRTACEVKVNSFEEALEAVKEGDYDCIHSKILYDTEELLNPEDNNNHSTVEIYSEDMDKLYWDNKE